jgi:glycosyltransferase involved in cell wall biosynthesis
MRIDVVIPAYNEEAIIAETAREVTEALKALPYESHVVVADNGSTDETAIRAVEAGVSVLAVPTKGKGAALVYAAQNSSAPLFAFIDADLSAHPSEIPRLITTLEQKSADIVIGSRLSDESTVNRSFLRTLSSRIFNLLRHLILGISVTDSQCGLKLMNERGRQLLAECKETGWFVDLELLARAERAGLVIHEVPVAWEEFRYANRPSKLNVVTDGIKAVEAMWRIRQRLS